MMSPIAVSLIAGYQRWLSPRKGFSCAHRVLHRGPSCSEYAKGICMRRGFFAALRALRGRFGECRRAADALAARRALMASVAPDEGFEFAGHPRPEAGGSNSDGEEAGAKKTKARTGGGTTTDAFCNALACSGDACSLGDLVGIDACCGAAACG